MQTFTRSQLKRLSNILDNAGQVLFGYLVLSPIFNPDSLGKTITVVTLGICMTILSWGLSLKIERIVI